MSCWPGAEGVSHRVERCPRRARRGWVMLRPAQAKALANALHEDGPAGTTPVVRPQLGSQRIPLVPCLVEW